MGILGRKKKEDKYKRENFDDIEELDIPEVEIPIVTEEKKITPKQINEQESVLSKKIDLLQKQIDEIKQQEAVNPAPTQERKMIVREYKQHPITGETITEYYDKKTGILWKFMTDLEYLTQLANKSN